SATLRAVASTLADAIVDGQRTGTADDQRRETCEVEQVGFVSRRAELRPRRRNCTKLDRAEAVREMHREHRDEKDDRERNARDGHEGAGQNRQATQELEHDREPTHDERGRYM